MPTAIEWAQETWNPVTGCSKLSEGCRNCYAERFAARLAGQDRKRVRQGLASRHGYPLDRPFRVTMHPERLDQPRHWRKPRLVFVCSMGDICHEKVPWDFIQQVFEAALQAPQHTYLFLTKRPKNLRRVIDHWNLALPDNWWIGVSVEAQQYMGRVLELLSIPAAVHFVSYEPALGPLTFPQELLSLGRRAWVVCGGETGPGARIMHPDWVRWAAAQCQVNGVPFFFKSWGAWGDFRALQRWRQSKRRDFPPLYQDVAGGRWCVGKKYTGRELDGRTWDEYPASARQAA